jgi:hypothetical protein
VKWTVTVTAQGEVSEAVTVTAETMNSGTNCLHGSISEYNDHDYWNLTPDLTLDSKMRIRFRSW